MIFSIQLDNSSLSVFTFCASPHDGWMQGHSGSIETGSNVPLNKIKTQSMILMISFGGLANFLTVAMSAGLIVCKMFYHGF